ncbi:MAG: hypothetical protein WA761_06865, partial [Thermoplasmata archaeon]
VDDLNGDVYLPNGAPSDGVTVVNETSGDVITSISAGLGSAFATLDYRNGDIYVANQESDTVSVISGVSNQVIATVPVQGTPYSMIADNSTGNVFVAAGDINWSTGSLSGAVGTDISGSTSQVLGSVPLGDDFQGFAGVTATGGILCETAGALVVVNATTNRIVESVPEPLTPSSVAFDPVTGQVYLSSFTAGAVEVLSGIPAPPELSSVSSASLGLEVGILAQSSALVALAVVLLVSRGHERTRLQF